MEFPPFSATTTGEKASQTDGFQSIRRINRHPLRSRDKDAPPRLRVSRSSQRKTRAETFYALRSTAPTAAAVLTLTRHSERSIIACRSPAFTLFVEFDAIMLTWDR